MAGLTDSGFLPLTLSEIRADLEQRLQESFGGTALDLSSQSVLGQLVGILANANADLWAMGQGLYANTYPSGASGQGVDHILAINNLARLAAKPTVTNPIASTGDGGVARYGLVCFGTPGTLVPAGTLLSNGAAAPATFSLDQAVLIGPASNAQQVLYFTNVPTSGSYRLTITTPGGQALTTPAIPYDLDVTGTRLGFTSYPAPGTSNFTLSLNGVTTAPIKTATDDDSEGTYATLAAEQIQAAINAVDGFSSARVTAAAQAFVVNWGAAAVPSIVVSGTGGPDRIVDSVASVINGLKAADGTYPFTDVLLQAGPQNITFLFGGASPRPGAPSTAGKPVALIKVQSSTLAAQGSQTAPTVRAKVPGNPAQGVGSATATATGPQVVLAGQLNTIINPVSGLTGVVNQLDCLTGRAVESDSEAIARLRATRGAASTGSLAAMMNRVRSLPGVSQCVGVQNLTNAAEQAILFASKPTQGAYVLQIGPAVTASIPYDASAAALQGAIRACPGYEQTTVAALGTTGFRIGFAGAAGKQAQPLVVVAGNTTGTMLTAYFGRPPHSVELVVQGGDDEAIARAILDTIPAGIASFSNPVQRTLAAVTAGSVSLSVVSAAGVEVGQSVEGAGLPAGARVVQVAGTTVTLSTAANASGTNVPVSFDHAVLLADAAGNPVTVGFSRPVTSLIYVLVQIKSDRFLVPGDATSGQNPLSVFSLDSVALVQSAIIDAVNAVEIGGTIVANGSNSLGGSFRSVAGIVDYTLVFDRTSPPTNTLNLPLAANEAPLAASFTVQVSYV